MKFVYWIFEYNGKHMYNLVNLSSRQI